jgi:hypothetical protein
LECDCWQQLWEHNCAELVASLEGAAPDGSERCRQFNHGEVVALFEGSLTFSVWTQFTV